MKKSMAKLTLHRKLGIGGDRIVSIIDELPTSSDGFFALWIARLIIIRDRYYKLK